MTFYWTDTLNEPLASLGRGREWNRVDQSRDGRWLVLPENDRGASGWHSVCGGRLQPLNPFDDTELPGVRREVREWMREGHGVRLLAWRVHRRAVFRLRTREGSRVCKFYRKERGQLKRWAAFGSAPGSAWTTPRTLDWAPCSRLLTIEDCPGISLNERWLAGKGDAADGDGIADLLDWLLATPLSADLPAHGAFEETRLLRNRLEAFQGTLRAPCPRAAELTRRVTRALLEDPRPGPVLCHRDLHDKQILLHGDRGGSLIDLDLVASGPPALDVGNILAHLRLRALQGAVVPWRRIAERIARRAVPVRSIADSLHRWTASALLRLTLIYSRRRRDEDLLANLLDSTGQALDRKGEWEGLL